jgi:hypothetical protein
MQIADAAEVRAAGTTLDPQRAEMEQLRAMHRQLADQKSRTRPLEEEQELAAWAWELQKASPGPQGPSSLLESRLPWIPRRRACRDQIQGRGRWHPARLVLRHLPEAPAWGRTWALRVPKTMRCVQVGQAWQVWLKRQVSLRWGAVAGAVEVQEIPPLDDAAEEQERLVELEEQQVVAELARERCERQTASWRTKTRDANARAGLEGLTGGETTGATETATGADKCSSFHSSSSTWLPVLGATGAAASDATAVGSSFHSSSSACETDVGAAGCGNGVATTGAGDSAATGCGSEGAGVAGEAVQFARGPMRDERLTGGGGPGRDGLAVVGLAGGVGDDFARGAAGSATAGGETTGAAIGATTGAAGASGCSISASTARSMAGSTACLT